MQPITIKMHIPSGNAKSLRTVEISNWTGKAIAAPRTEIEALLDREEIKRPGVYLLMGSDMNTGDPRVYIGEAEDVATRIKQHKEKDFWVHVVVFVSKDENLTKSHIKYLEGKLIDRAIEVGKAIVENGKASGASLPESDRADMEVFLQKILQLLPVIGTEVFSPIRVESTHKNSPILFCSKRDVKASGQRTENGFVVFKNSQAVVSETPSVPVSVHDLRLILLEKGILTLKEGAYVFTKDFEFTSPSIAAAVVRGASANGQIEWKDKEGRVLKSIEAV